MSFSKSKLTHYAVFITPPEILVESLWSPPVVHGVLVESTCSPSTPCPVHLQSVPSPSLVHSPSTWTPQGLHKEDY